MSEPELNLTPTRPYLARAIYEWICDNNLTPYLLVDATQPYTDVPQQFVQDGQIVLNLAPHSVHMLNMSNDAITFSARFSGASKDLYIPMNAVLGLYARENGQGLFFDPDEYANVQIEEDALKSNKSDETEITTDAPKKKIELTHFRIEQGELNGF
jgi:stringent starvation protein B